MNEDTPSATEGTQAWTNFFYEAFEGKVRIPRFNADHVEIFLESRGLDLKKFRGTETVPAWILGRLNLPEGTSFDALATHLMIHGLIDEFQHLGRGAVKWADDDDDDDEDF